MSEHEWIIAGLSYLAGMIITLGILTAAELRDHGWRNDR